MNKSKEYKEGVEAYTKGIIVNPYAEKEPYNFIHIGEWRIGWRNCKLIGKENALKLKDIHDLKSYD